MEYITYPSTMGIYYLWGGIGSTVAEGCMLLFGTPLYTDYKPGHVYREWWRGGKKLHDAIKPWGD